MENVFYFAFVGLIVIISLYAILKILIKKFDPEKTRVKLYGILGGMSNKEVISVSSSIINYIFMVYLMVSFIDVDIYIIIIVLFLNLLSFLLIGLANTLGNLFMLTPLQYFMINILKIHILKL